VSLFQVELGGGQKPLEVEGWAGIDGMYEAAAKQSDKQFQEHLDMASTFREALATPAGRRMLDYLVRQYFMQRIVRPGDEEHAPGIRQGQQDVVRFMISMVEFANSGGGRQTGPGANSGASP
jgi:hypothetical protein